MYLNIIKLQTRSNFLTNKHSDISLIYTQFWIFHNIPNMRPHDSIPSFLISWLTSFREVNLSANAINSESLLWLGESSSLSFLKSWDIKLHDLNIIPSQSLNLGGRRGTHHRWRCNNTFPSFPVFPVFRCTQGISKLLFCPFFDVIVPSLPLSSSHSCSFHCPLQTCLRHARGSWDVAIPCDHDLNIATSKQGLKIKFRYT